MGLETRGRKGGGWLVGWLEKQGLIAEFDDKDIDIPKTSAKCLSRNRSQRTISSDINNNTTTIMSLARNTAYESVMPALLEKDWTSDQVTSTSSQQSYRYRKVQGKYKMRKIVKMVVIAVVVPGGGGLRDHCSLPRYRRLSFLLRGGTTTSSYCARILCDSKRGEQ